MTEDTVESTEDDSKYAGLARGHAAALKRRDASSAKLAKLEAKYQKAQAAFAEVSEGYADKRDGLKRDVAVATLQARTFEIQDAEIEKVLAELNGEQIPGQMEFSEVTV